MNNKINLDCSGIESLVMEPVSLLELIQYVVNQAEQTESPRDTIRAQYLVPVIDEETNELRLRIISSEMSTV